MSFQDPLPLPPTALACHRQLSPLAGVHVSPICLGSGNIGYKWGKYGMGEMNKASSFKLLDAYYEAGGNFIDTANNYDNGTSEEVIGEWTEECGIRDKIVLTTKYLSIHKRDQPMKQRTHYAGNNMKALHISVKNSMKSLQMSYIDILYVHWDFNTTVEEVMNGLHHLVAAGQVLYLGISDTPAWIIAEANTYTQLMGKTPFVVYQGAWSIFQQDSERDIVSMACSLGLALVPWNVLAGGKIRTDTEKECRRLTGEKGRTLLDPSWERTPEQRKVCLALEHVVQEVGTKSISAVAIAYIMHKTPHVFPVVGGCKVKQLIDNVEVLDIALTDDHIKYLESVLPFYVGFPHNFVGDGTKNSKSFKAAGHFDKWPTLQPIIPSCRN